MSVLHITEPPADTIPAVALAGRFTPTHNAVLLHLADYEQKSPGALALRIIEQIGKRTDLKGTRSVREQEHKQYLPIWIEAHGIATAVIPDAQRLRPWIVRTVTDLAPTVERIVLVAEPGHADATLADLRRYGLDVSFLPWNTFTAEHPVLDPAAAPAQAPYGLEHLPNVDFLLFRHRCRAHNSPARFAVIDTDYRHAFAAASDVDADEAAVMALLAEHVRAATTTAQILVAIRATQRALFARGILMQAHPDRLLGTLSAIQPPALSDHHWTALRTYIRPERAAIVALYLLGVPTDSLRTMTIAEIERPLATRTIAGHPLPDKARPYLLAQLLRRRQEHASEDDAFVVLSGTRRHQEILTDARRDLDLPIDGRNLSNDHKTHHDRPLYRIGLQIRTLT